MENPEDFRPKAAKGALEDVEEEEEAEEDAQCNDNYTDREKDKEKERETEGVIFYRGILMGAMRNCCQSSFQRQPQRLMWAVYSCSILATKKILGVCVCSCVCMRVSVCACVLVFVCVSVCV